MSLLGNNNQNWGSIGGAFAVGDAGWHNVNNDRSFKGSISNVGIWKRGLTTEEVIALYNSFKYKTVDIPLGTLSSGAHDLVLTATNGTKHRHHNSFRRGYRVSGQSYCSIFYGF